MATLARSLTIPTGRFWGAKRRGHDYRARACGALIDERKARSRCAASFPAVVVAWSAELLTNDPVAAALEAERQAEALVNALLNARIWIRESAVGSSRDIFAGLFTFEGSACTVAAHAT